MRAIDANGVAGQWNEWCGNDVFPCDSPAGFTTTFDDVTPAIPALRIRDSAHDGAPPAGPSGLPTTDAPVLAWDPVLGASSYELQLAPWETGGVCGWTSIDGRTFITAATAWTPLGSGAATSPVGNAHPSVTTDSTSLPGGATYCVRVRARSDRDAQGKEIASDWTQLGGVGNPGFTYEAAVLPTCGATAMPASAYHAGEPQTPTPRVPLFTWDRVDGACGYFVVVAKDPQFTQVVDVAFTNAPAYAPRTASGPKTYTDETTAYYWVVMPSASADGSGVATAPQDDHPQTFSKRSIPPTLLSPKAGVSGVPSFRWSAAEGARQYRIQVDADRNFGSPVTDVVTDSTAYTSTTKLPAGTALYWRVRAEDETLAALSWSATGTFTALAPETNLQTPAPSLNGSTASFGFSSTKAGSSFDCRLDGPGAEAAPWTACASPAPYADLADGEYVFSVRATDALGHTDATPATRTFTVDTRAPDTVINSQTENDRGASFAFTASEAPATFECRLERPDGTADAWSTCTSPDGYDGLGAGSYRFTVRATDAAGNVDASPATRTFTVAEPPPVDPGGNDAAVPISSAPGSGPQPAAPPTPAAMLGVPVLHAPRGPVRIRRGTARLRFDCAEPAGCGAAAFVLRRRRGSGIAGFSATIRVPAGARGSRMVRVRFGPAARRVLRRLRRRPFWVTVVRTGAGATPTRLRLRNGR